MPQQGARGGGEADAGLLSQPHASDVAADGKARLFLDPAKVSADAVAQASHYRCSDLLGSRDHNNVSHS